MLKRWRYPSVTPCLAISCSSNGALSACLYLSSGRTRTHHTHASTTHYTALLHRCTTRGHIRHTLQSTSYVEGFNKCCKIKWRVRLPFQHYKFLQQISCRKASMPTAHFTLYFCAADVVVEEECTVLIFVCALLLRVGGCATLIAVFGCQGFAPL